MIMFEEVMNERVSNSSVQTTRTLRQSSSPVCLTQECTKYREIILKCQYTVDNVLQFENGSQKKSPRFRGEYSLLWKCTCKVNKWWNDTNFCYRKPFVRRFPLTPFAWKRRPISVRWLLVCMTSATRFANELIRSKWSRKELIFTVSSNLT